MPKVMYEMGGVSVDGYIVGPDGKSDGSLPDEERSDLTASTRALSPARDGAQHLKRLTRRQGR